MFLFAAYVVEATVAGAAAAVVVATTVAAAAKHLDCMQVPLKSVQVFCWTRSSHAVCWAMG